MENKSNTSKKSNGPEIREEMLRKGAIFFDFERPKDIEYVENDKQIVDWFKKMEEYGFLVSETGCILPYKNYYTHSKGRKKGYGLSASFFKGKPPTFPPHKYNWPVVTQISHLCHRNQCINPTHLHYEPQWKNLKRNYCGEDGHCDCGVVPSCISTYRNEKWEYNDTFITYETKDYKGKIKKLFKNSKYRFKILSSDYYKTEDEKKKTRNERLKKKRKRGESELKGNNKKGGKIK